MQQKRKLPSLSRCAGAFHDGMQQMASSSSPTRTQRPSTRKGGKVPLSTIQTQEMSQTGPGEQPQYHCNAQNQIKDLADKPVVEARINSCRGINRPRWPFRNKGDRGHKVHRSLLLQPKGRISKMQVERTRLIADFDKLQLGTNQLLVKSRRSLVVMNNLLGDVVSKIIASSHDLIKPLKPSPVLISFDPNKLSRKASFQTGEEEFPHVRIVRRNNGNLASVKGLHQPPSDPHKVEAIRNDNWMQSRSCRHRPCGNFCPLDCLMRRWKTPRPNNLKGTRTGRSNNSRRRNPNVRDRREEA